MTDKPPTTAEEWLADEDRASFDARARRLAFIVEEYGPARYQLIPGGYVPIQALDEAKWTFVNGQFMACVFLCQAMLEHVLAGQYVLMGHGNTKRAGFKILCEKARQDGIISDDEYNAFDSLRERRNPYTHPKAYSDPLRIERRMLAEGKTYEEVMEDDARHAISAVFRLLKRHPFAFPDEAEEMKPPHEQ